MINPQNAIRELAAVAQQRAHLAAIRHLQNALLHELEAAGVKGVDQQLADLNATIGFYEDSVAGRYDNTLFELLQLQSPA